MLFRSTPIFCVGRTLAEIVIAEEYPPVFCVGGTFELSEIEENESAPVSCVGLTINSHGNFIAHGDLSSHDIHAISHIIAYASFLCWSHNILLVECKGTFANFLCR